MTTKGSVPVEELQKALDTTYKDWEEESRLHMLTVYINRLIASRTDKEVDQAEKQIDWAKVDYDTDIKVCSVLRKFVVYHNGFIYFDTSPHIAPSLDFVPPDGVELANPDEAPEHWFKPCQT